MKVPEDKWWWQRNQQAKAMGVSPELLEDEPDYMAIDDQGYDEQHEGER